MYHLLFELKANRFEVFGALFCTNLVDKRRSQFVQKSAPTPSKLLSFIYQLPLRFSFIPKQRLYPHRHQGKPQWTARQNKMSSPISLRQLGTHCSDVLGFGCWFFRPVTEVVFILHRGRIRRVEEPPISRSFWVVYKPSLQGYKPGYHVSCTCTVQAGRASAIAITNSLPHRKIGWASHLNFKDQSSLFFDKEIETARVERWVWR